MSELELTGSFTSTTVIDGSTHTVASQRPLGTVVRVHACEWHPALLHMCTATSRARARNQDWAGTSFYSSIDSHQCMQPMQASFDQETTIAERRIVAQCSFRFWHGAARERMRMPNGPEARESSRSAHLGQL